MSPDPEGDHATLGGFFSRAPERVRAALRRLDAVTHGEVHQVGLVGTGRPQPGGLLCARLFGPWEDDTCACGRVRGDARLRGTTCPRCHVPIGPASWRAERWAHIALAVPVLHPAGIQVDRVPVPPPASRPLGRVDAPASGRLRPPPAAVPGADNQALHDLVARNGRVRRLAELGAPAFIVDHEVALLSHAVAEVVRLLALPVDHPQRAAGREVLWRSPDAPQPARLTLSLPPPAARAQLPTAPIAVAFVGNGDVLVQWPHVLHRVVPATGEVRRAFPGVEWALLGVRGAHALFADPYGQDLDEDGVLHGVGVLDLERGQWCDAPPEGLPLVTVNKGEPEEAWLCDWRTGRTAAAAEDRSGDRPAELARSPDLGFVWISSMPDDGALQSLETAQCHLLLSSVGLDAAGDGCDRDDDLAVLAFARGEDDLWRILDAFGGVSVDGDRRFRVPPRVTAAAFSPDGRRLALASAGALEVVDVDTGDTVVAAALTP